MPASRPDYCGRRDDWRLQDGRILTATTPTSGMQLVPNTIAMSHLHLDGEALLGKRNVV